MPKTSPKTSSYRLTITVLALLLSCMAACDGGRKFEIANSKGGVIRIPVKKVSDGGVHFFTYRYHKGPFSTKNINFFVRMDGKGQLHTHFDACFTCYKFKKGYYADGTDLVCIECKKRFKLADAVWHDDEGCLPIDLSGEIKNGYIAIKVDSLLKGERYFF